MTWFRRNERRPFWRNVSIKLAIASDVGWRAIKRFSTCQWYPGKYRGAQVRQGNHQVDISSRAVPIELLTPRVLSCVSNRVPVLKYSIDIRSILLVITVLFCVITSAKEVMFSSLFVCLSVCLSVCLLATLRKNFQTDLHEFFRESWQWAIKHMITFWWWSGSGFRIRIATLLRRALATVCTVTLLPVYTYSVLYAADRFLTAKL